MDAFQHRITPFHDPTDSQTKLKLYSQLTSAYFLTEQFQKVIDLLDPDNKIVPGLGPIHDMVLSRKNITDDQEREKTRSFLSAVDLIRYLNFKIIRNRD